MKKTVKNNLELEVEKLKYEIHNLEIEKDMLGTQVSDCEKQIRWLGNRLDLQREMFRELIGLDKVKKEDTTLPF